ncbi:MAG: NAD(P)H-binding protein [Bacteriovoracaceae bacterium]|nr:NAD(P)H-binding protein [Bacteriovoracaceae bacterium]
MSLKVTVAGASGFIGNGLLNLIKSKYQVRGMSRSQRSNEEDIEWVSADLFSYRSVKSALKDTDVAIYLVHSMLPTSRLFQGSFEDTDLLLADNFARACKKNNVKQIIYLGGLDPVQNSSSKHLSSRKEVEHVLKSTGISTTVLRAGMVVGNGGSSFEILKNLVLNLPAMVLPLWTNSPTQTIYIDDLLRVIEHSIDNDEMIDKTINVVNGENINYRQLIEQSSAYFQGPKILIPVPINYTSFSKLWVKIFGQADYELVSPLIDSLVCDLSYPEIPKEIEKLIKYRHFSEMLKQIPKERIRRSYKRKKDNCNSVRSMQRLSDNEQLHAKDISDEYVDWLPRKMKNLIQVKGEGGHLNFTLIGLSSPLLILQRQKETEDLDRVKFHIVGGLLSKTKDTAWLEFRKISGGKFTLSTINDFVPSLPWYVYKYSQALIHLKVMNDFSNHLKRGKREEN